MEHGAGGYHVLRCENKQLEQDKRAVTSLGREFEERLPLRVRSWGGHVD
jgi:very-short-patch-repair endonuclease